MAVGAALLCSALAPVQSAIWNGAEAPGWIAWLVPLLGNDGSGAGAASVEQPPALYFLFGRLVLLVYAGLLASLWRSPLDAPKRLAWAFLAALGVACFGDALAYGFVQWLGP